MAFPSIRTGQEKVLPHKKEVFLFFLQLPGLIEKRGGRQTPNRFPYFYAELLFRGLVCQPAQNSSILARLKRRNREEPETPRI